MARFYVITSSVEMAGQIADILNSNNDLLKKYTQTDILTGTVDYFVELYGSKVIGCIGLEKMNTDTSRIKHLSVLPEYRRRGISKRLIESAFVNCDTSQVYATIRANNIPSIKAAMANGFVQTEYMDKNGYVLITMWRRKWKA